MTELQPPSPAKMFSQPPEWIFDCRFVEENAAGLALDALEPDETMRITHHLSWCPNCARLVHEMRKTVGYLPFTSTEAAPSASAKTRLFERINATEQASPSPTFATQTIPASTIQVVKPAPARASSPPAAPPRERRRFKWEIIAAPLAAVPLVFALAIVGGWALRTQDRLNDQVAQAQTREDEIAHLSEQVSLLSNGLVNPMTTEFVLNSAGSNIGGSTATGTLRGVVNQPSATLSVQNLPTNTDGYQVIAETKDGKTHPAGTFDVDESGNAIYELKLTRPLQEYRSIHVKMRFGPERNVINDSVVAADILWVDMGSNLGAPGGTEANANAH